MAVPPKVSSVGNDERPVFQENIAISTNFRHNEQIRISPIRLIDEKEEQIGIVSLADGQKRARDAGLDLVEVAPTARPPVCRIMDYGKYRYQQQKKADKSRASSRAGQLKELKLKTVKIGDHDLQIEINHARKFLEEGNKVQFTLQFRGREIAHTELGRHLFTKIKTELWQFSKIERDAKMEGRRMTLVLQPDHKSPDSKPPVPAAAPLRPVVRPPMLTPSTGAPGAAGAPGIAGTAAIAGALGQPSEPGTAKAPAAPVGGVISGNPAPSTPVDAPPVQRPAVAARPATAAPAPSTTRPAAATVPAESRA